VLSFAWHGPTRCEIFSATSSVHGAKKKKSKQQIYNNSVIMTIGCGVVVGFAVLSFQRPDS
jgi:Na+-driven multidrug efflux pump